MVDDCLYDINVLHPSGAVVAALLLLCGRFGIFRACGTRVSMGIIIVPLDWKQLPNAQTKHESH